MSGFLVKQKGLYYYKCQKRCKGVNISAKKLHEEFAFNLNNYQVDPEMLSLMEEVMEYKLIEMSKEDVNEIKTIKAALTKKQNELESLEERFVTNKIDGELYYKYSQKFKEQINQYSAKLNNPHVSGSNLKKCIKKGLKLSRNISDLWASSDSDEKQKLQHLLFPEGIAYDKQNKEVLTFRTNTFFELISCFSVRFKQNKSGDKIKKDQISALVTPAGFKPATLRAEI